jgi:hypothetical protein
VNPFFAAAHSTQSRQLRRRVKTVVLATVVVVVVVFVPGILFLKRLVWVRRSRTMAPAFADGTGMRNEFDSVVGDAVKRCGALHGCTRRKVDFGRTSRQFQGLGLLLVRRCGGGREVVVA